MRLRSAVLTLRTKPGPFALDVALAALLTAVVQFEVWSGGRALGWKLVTAVLFLLATIPLVWRRKAPLAMAAARTAGLVGQAVLTRNAPESAGLVLSALVAGYSVAAYSERRRALVAVLLIGVGGAIRELYDPALHTAAQLWAGAFFWLLLAATFVFGTYVRSRRRAASLEDRAARLEREREEQARAAVAEERRRIARELHDVIAHCVSVVVVQAVAATGILESEPERAREPLRMIEQSGREALAETRRLLGILREDEGQARLTPQPGLVDLEAMVDHVRSAGLPVELEVEGEVEELPRGVDLSAYRIVQEALTNALKHAGPARAHVRVSYEPGFVDLEVSDNGPGAAATNGSGGHGLVGMRERVALYGGSFEAKQGAAGGFVVRARLPLGRESM